MSTNQISHIVALPPFPNHFKTLLNSRFENYPLNCFPYFPKFAGIQNLCEILTPFSLTYILLEYLPRIIFKSSRFAVPSKNFSYYSENKIDITIKLFLLFTNFFWKAYTYILQENVVNFSSIVSHSTSHPPRTRLNLITFWIETYHWRFFFLFVSLQETWQQPARCKRWKN